MADFEETQETVASISVKIKEAEKQLEAVVGENFDIDAITRIVNETIAPLQARKARLILVENKEQINIALEGLRDMISDVISSSGLADLIGEPIEKISWFNEEGKAYLNVNPKNLRRLPKPRAKKEAVKEVNTGLSEADEVFRVVDGQREDMTVGEAVQKFASPEVKATSVWDKKAWSTLFPKVNEDLGEQKFTLVAK